MSGARIVLSLAALFAAAAWAAAQAPSGGKPYLLTERSDFSKYVDGKYVGHVYRETRSRVEGVAMRDGSSRYEGVALLLEETLRDMRAAARPIDAVVDVAFVVRPSGSVEIPPGSGDSGLPVYRGFPSAIPPDAEAAGAGLRWQLPASYVARPDRDAPPTRIPVLVEYRYDGPAEYRGSPAVAVNAKFATRYRGTDRTGDPALREASGTHDADIVLDPENGSPLFIRDRMDETFRYADGRTLRFSGFSLLFFENAPAPERGMTARILGADRPAVAVAPATRAPGYGGDGGNGGNGERSAGGTTAGSPAQGAPVPAAPSSDGVRLPLAKGVQPGGIEIAETGRGIVLILFDLRFKPDSPELLTGEESRLDYVARALGGIPDRTFLVEGHTADVGNPSGELALSKERARKIVDELAKRGIPESRFVYRGLGAAKPVASNADEAGKARNRRVEITVLDF